MLNGTDGITQQVYRVSCRLWLFSFAFIRRIILPLVHTVENGAVAGAAVAHKNQRERHAVADRQFACASDNAEFRRLG